MSSFDLENDKDSRKSNKMKKEAKNNHSYFMVKGPEYISKNELVAGKYPSSSGDPLGITCDDVVHSVNKHKRWEIFSKAEYILIEENTQGKTSLVSTSFSRPVACCWFSAGAYDERARRKCRAGVDSYLEVSDDNVFKNKAKSSRTSLASLESTSSTNNVDVAGHTRYTKVSFTPIQSKDIERGWRYHQKRHLPAPWNAQRVDTVDKGDWHNINQDELEDRLEQAYKNKMEDEDSFVL